MAEPASHAPMPAHSMSRESRAAPSAARNPLRIWYDTKSGASVPKIPAMAPGAQLQESRVQSSQPALPARIQDVPALVAHIAAEAVDLDESDPRASFRQAIEIAESCFGTKADDRFRNELVRHDGRWLPEHRPGELGFDDLKRAVQGGVSREAALRSVSLSPDALEHGQISELDDIHSKNVARANDARRQAILSEYCRTARGQAARQLRGIPEDRAVSSLQEIFFPGRDIDAEAALVFRANEIVGCATDVEDFARKLGFDGHHEYQALVEAVTADRADPFVTASAAKRRLADQRATMFWNIALRKFGGLPVWQDLGGSQASLEALKIQAISSVSGEIETLVAHTPMDLAELEGACVARLRTLLITTRDSSLSRVLARGGQAQPSEARGERGCSIS